uniref:B-hordein n=1 Tax=Hordeum vulgare subsp. vulgare TaxID=112509 RepID=A0A0K2GRS6_HORVV|nr:B-hordein precursor [Hordeum vulgare subsp. vulgare]
MKTFLIFALLAIAATSTIAQQQPFPQQPIPQQPQPYPQQPQPYPQQPQQPFPQQTIPQQPQPYPQQPQPYPQQPFPPQQAFPQQPPFWPQQPFPQQPPFGLQQPILSQQQPCTPQQTPLPQGQLYQTLLQLQIPHVQPSILQQLNPCKVFLQQQCSPVRMQQLIARSQMLQQSSCHVLQQQCCQQLPQIPEQFRHEAIRAIVYSIFLQEQPQQSVQGVSQPQQQLQQEQVGQCYFQQPQPQQLGQPQQVPQSVFLQPHQIAQLEATTSIALRTLPTMCNVNVPLYDIMPFGVGTRVGV